MFGFCSGVSTSVSKGVCDVSRLLTAKQVAELLQIGLSTVYEKADKGKLPHVRIDNIVRFPEDQLARWIEEHTRAAI